MYNKFFGFKEKPFKLVPNPEYLFLSKSHEEILAHLAYALSQGDGFVEITGEVGTGKTTLCRVFLENLDKSVEAAYIFNPKLDALQLLKVINDEFGIDSSPNNTKELIDILNAFLIEKKAAGQNVLLLIDEAQNLSHEVLEQLRLLSNLETTQKKLLQIILVGQPELGEILASHQLRQLGQRITINCRLSPLTFDETNDYIRHRISLASHRAGPHFDKGACRAIYKFSRGIPRLINIACDRALLNAFSRNSFNITASIANEAIKELTGEKSGYSSRWLQGRSGLVILTAVLCILGIILLSHLSGQPLKTFVAEKVVRVSQAFFTAGQELLQKKKQAPPVSKTVVSSESKPIILPQPDSAANQLPTATASEDNEKLSPANSPEQSQQNNQTRASLPVALDDKSFLDYLAGLTPRDSRRSALMAALKLWFPATPEIMVTQREIDADPFFFQETTMFYGLQVLHLVTDADLALVQKINLPAIFTFYAEDTPKYLTAVSIDAEHLYFIDVDHNRELMIDKNVVLKNWSGEAYVIWKNFLNLQGMITPGAQGEEVKNLQAILQRLGYRQLDITGRYGKESVEIIKHIQKKNGVKDDGLIGPLTKIILYNENDSYVKPSLAAFTGSRTGE